MCNQKAAEEIYTTPADLIDQEVIPAIENGSYATRDMFDISAIVDELIATAETTHETENETVSWVSGYYLRGTDDDFWSCVMKHQRTGIDETYEAIKQRITERHPDIAVTITEQGTRSNDDHCLTLTANDEECAELRISADYLGNIETFTVDDGEETQTVDGDFYNEEGETTALVNAAIAALEGRIERTLAGNAKD